MPEVWLPWLSVSLVAVLVARWSWLARRVSFSALLDLTGAALIVLAWHPNVWARLSQGYPGDSIFTLSPTGRIGLIAFTVLLVILLVCLSTYKSRWLQKTGGAWHGSRANLPALDILLTIVLFVIGLTVVPQLHFAYYHLLFDNLPQQWVIKPLSLKTVWHTLLVPRETNLAMHSAGLCGWWMIILAALSWLRSLRLTNHMGWLVGFAALANIAWHRFA